jgi:hypothetical protein
MGCHIDLKRNEVGRANHSCGHLISGKELSLIINKIITKEEITPIVDNFL